MILAIDTPDAGGMYRLLRDNNFTGPTPPPGEAVTVDLVTYTVVERKWSFSKDGDHFCFLVVKQGAP
jgi:hypothetical protein